MVDVVVVLETQGYRFPLSGTTCLIISANWAMSVLGFVEKKASMTHRKSHTIKWNLCWVLKTITFWLSIQAKLKKSTLWVPICFRKQKIKIY